MPGLLKRETPVTVPKSSASCDPSTYASHGGNSKACGLCELFPVILVDNAEKGTLSIQRVSHVSVSNDDVLKFCDQYRTLMSLRKSQDGDEWRFSDKAYEVTMDAMSELTRQVALTCSDQGLLLHKLRVEISKCIERRKSLYASVTKQRIKRFVSENISKANTDAANQKRSEDAVKLKEQIESSRQTLERADAEFSALFATRESKNEEELRDLAEQLSELSTQLEEMIGGSSDSRDPTKLNSS